MIIPYQYNKMGAGTAVIDLDRAVAGSRGVFTYLRNGSCNQSGMVMQRRFLASSKISRMEVYSAGTALYTTVHHGAGVTVHNGGVVSSTVVNSYASVLVNSGGTALDTELNSSGCLYVNSGGYARGGTSPCSAAVPAISGTPVPGGIWRWKAAV